MKKSLQLRFVLNIWKYPIFSLALSFGGKTLVTALEKDAGGLVKYSCRKKDVFACLVSYKNYATIFLSRIKRCRIIWLISRIIFPANKNIELLTDEIGPGLLVLHNLGAVIRAKSIGSNVTISQGVTIGEGGDQNNSNADNIPTIGNDVLIATNALVLGNLMIGDGAVIGAGAVVTKNVEPNTVVVGNPAHVLKYINK